MTDNNPTDVDRRTVLKASSAAITTGVFSTTVVSASDEDTDSKTQRTRQPDVNIIDNSKSDEPVQLNFVDSGTKKTFSKTSVATKGVNHPSFEKTSLDKRSEQAKEKIEIIETPYTGQIQIEATHMDKSDTTMVNLLKGNVPSDMTVDIYINPDGSVSAFTSVYCEG